MGLQRENRPLLVKRGLRFDLVDSTSPGTVGRPDSMIALASTTTGAPGVWTLANPSKGGGDFIMVGCKTVGTTSAGAGVHLRTSSSGITFDGGNDLITFSSEGAGVSLVSESSSRWIIMSANAIALSTST